MPFLSIRRMPAVVRRRLTNGFRFQPRNGAAADWAGTALGFVVGVETLLPTIGFLPVT